MKNVTIELSEEHQNILRVIDALLEKCNQIENGESAEPAYFGDVISFIKNYADGFHHHKEEDILFKAMLESGDCMHCNPIPVMLYEHDEGRHYVKMMQEALESENMDLMIENARNYCLLLQNHIYKEDNILYPMAEEALSEEQKEAVESQYARVNVTDFLDSDIESVIARLTKLD